MTLPVEVRCLIYSACMDVGEVYPYHKGRSSYVKRRSPCGQLLRTCKAIHEEAEPVLYRNTFVLTTFEGIEKLLNNCLYNQSRRLWLKSIKIRFFFNGIKDDTAILEAQSRMIDEDMEDLPDDSTSTRFMRILHKVVKFHTRELYWSPMVALVLENLKPVRLELDLRDSFCFKRCCGMQISAICCFRSGFALGAPPMVKLWGLNGFDDSAAETVADELARKVITLWTLERNGRTDSNLVAELGNDVNAHLLHDVDEEEQSNGVW